MKKLFIIFLLLFALLPTATIVHSQEIGLYLSPSTVQTFIKPGKTVLLTFYIDNNADPVLAKIVVLPFTPKGSYGAIDIKNQPEGPLEFNLDNSDIQMNSEFLINTKERKQILLRVHVPENVQEKDYYYSFGLETQPPPTTEGVISSRIKTTLVSNLLFSVTMNGTTETNTSLIFFDILNGFKLPFTSIKVIDSSDVVPVSLIIGNQGKHAVTAVGKITLNGPFGQKADYQLNPASILAQSQKRLTSEQGFKANCTNQTKKGCEPAVSLNLKGLFIGEYSLKGAIDYGQYKQKTYINTTFVGIPFKFTLLILILFVVFFIVKNRLKAKD